MVLIVLQGMHLISSRKFEKYDIPWFTKTDLVVSILDVDANKVYDEHVISGGSACGNIRVIRIKTLTK